jgi:hypothetical protein
LAKRCECTLADNNVHAIKLRDFTRERGVSREVYTAVAPIVLLACGTLAFYFFNDINSATPTCRFPHFLIYLFLALEYQVEGGILGYDPAMLLCDDDEELCFEELRMRHLSTKSRSSTVKGVVAQQVNMAQVPTESAPRSLGKFVSLTV